MKKHAVLLTILAGTVLLSNGAWAVRTAYWNVTGREEMCLGSPTDVTIGPLGSIELSPPFEEIGSIGEYYAWTMVSGADGNIHVGTGDDGKIYTIDTNGEAGLLFDSIELDILSLAIDAEGNLYAGTSPDGIIFRIDGDGNANSFFDSPEHYIWDMTFDNDGNLYAVTGEQGKVYRIDSSGRPELFYQSPEINVLSILFDAPRNRFLLGGAGNGLLLSVDRDGEGRVLFESPRDEVGAIALAGDGAVYMAASGSSEENSKNGDKKTPRSILYRIEPEGSVVLVWRSNAEFIYALDIDGDGNILVGTGSPGSLTLVTPDGEATELKRTAESQVLDLLRSGGGVYVCTGNQGVVYRVGAGRSAEGSYESEVRDMANTARWGNLRWWGSEPDGTTIQFLTRSGNRKTPDDTWSDWEPVGRGEKIDRIASPSGRYIQWKVEMEGNGKASPRLDRVSLAFKEHNLPPRVLKLDVTRLGSTFFKGPVDTRPEPMYQVLPGGTRVEYMPVSGEGIEIEGADEIWARSVRVAQWETADPNGDKLIHDVYYRAESETEWKPIEKDMKFSYCAWDTRLVEDGLYRIRVVTRDDPANPEASALSGERIGDPFLVDNTVPRIHNLSASRKDGRLEITAEGKDELSILWNAAYSLNAGEWRTVDCSDGIFDDHSEKFRFSVEAPEGNEHVLTLKITDHAGNEVLGKVVIR